MGTENAVHALIRQAIADLQPRIAIAAGNIARAEREATEARETLAELTTERNAYLAALPAEPEADADAGEAVNALNEHGLYADAGVTSYTGTDEADAE